MARVISRRLLFGLIPALYLLAFPYHPPLRSPNELCRLWQTRALVEYRTLAINQALRDYGYVGDLSVKDGQYFPSKAPLLSFAAVPVYLMLRLWGGGGRYAVPEVALVFWSRLFITVLPTLLMLVFLHRFLRAYLSDAWADVMVATYAVGSLALGYSLLFISHQPTSVLLFFCFYALWRAGRGATGRAYLAAGALAGAATACEYTSVLTLLPLVVYAALNVATQFGDPKERVRGLGRALALATLGAAPFVIALMIYHQACFGGPFESGYRYLNDPGYQGWHVGGFLGIGLPDARALILSAFSPLRGLFVLSPFLLLAIPGLLLMWKQYRRGDKSLGPLFWLSLLQLIAHAYFTSSFSYESWGWATGPRHMTPLIPYLLLPAGWVLQECANRSSAEARLGLVVGLGLCVTSILMNGAVGLVNYIPDTLSSAFFGLVWPLYQAGYLPPTLLAFAGLANPWSGAVALLLLVVIAALTLTTGLGAAEKQTDGGSHSRSRVAWEYFVACTVVVIHFGLVRAVTRNDAADKAAVRHLESVWLVPPGKPADFWPRS